MEPEPDMTQGALESPAEHPPLISIDIPLQIDEIRATELSSSRRNTASQHRIPRHLIIEELGKIGFKAQVLGHHLGSYRGRPACLLLMRFAFFGIGTRHRIRKA